MDGDKREPSIVKEALAEREGEKGGGGSKVGVEKGKKGRTKEGEKLASLLLFLFLSLSRFSLSLSSHSHLRGSSCSASA